jgi:glycopeptide antibiotics resistance protein
VAKKDVALVASLCLILALTAVPRSRPSTVELVPLGDIVNGIREGHQGLLVEGIVESAANVALFMPLGAALALRAWSIRRVALYAAVISAVIEGAQLLVISGRTASVSDVLLNTLGAVFGSFAVGRVRKSQRERSA